MNRICLVGRLAQDADLRYSPKGVAVATLTLAVASPSGSEESTNFIDVVIFRRLAEALTQYLRKGRMISVDGRLAVRKVNGDGPALKVTEVIADRVRLLDRSDQEESG